MSDTAVPPRRLQAVGAARVEWGALGVLGRVAFVGVVFSLAVAVGLGILIPRLVRGHLLDARAELIANIGDEIAELGLLPVGPPSSASYELLEQEIGFNLLGGETVRVKLWTPDGTVVYSDDERLVGRQFDMDATFDRARDGSPTYTFSDNTEPAHAFEDLGPEIMEFFVPVHASDQTVIGVFEVEQRTDALNATMGEVQRNVWLAIGTGIALLGIFMATLAASAARGLDRRRRQAERLLGALFRAQEDERHRIVGALHDDVGQPLFRLLYGLEGSRAALAADHPVRPELEHLIDLTRDIDGTLRDELRALHRGVEEDLGLVSSIEQIVATMTDESDLMIDLDTDDVDSCPIGQPAKIALLHAAREGIINVRKHANASHAKVELRCTSLDVIVSVSDDGTGDRQPDGLGMVTTRERLEAIGGRLKVTSTRGRGTTFHAMVPILGEKR